MRWIENPETPEVDINRRQEELRAKLKAKMQSLTRTFSLRGLGRGFHLSSRSAMLWGIILADL